MSLSFLLLHFSLSVKFDVLEVVDFDIYNNLVRVRFIQKNGSNSCVVLQKEDCLMGNDSRYLVNNNSISRITLVHGKKFKNIICSTLEYDNFVRRDSNFDYAPLIDKICYLAPQQTLLSTCRHHLNLIDNNSKLELNHLLDNCKIATLFQLFMDYKRLYIYKKIPYKFYKHLYNFFSNVIILFVSLDLARTLSDDLYIRLYNEFVGVGEYQARQINNQKAVICHKDIADGDLQVSMNDLKNTVKIQIKSLLKTQDCFDIRSYLSI